MLKQPALALLSGIFLFPSLSGAAPREEWFRNLSLESAATSSDLILAARVTDVTEIPLMRGGKGASSMFQYKFKPERIIKGVFARDELSLGSGDLGLYQETDMREIRKGMLMLIFLGRSDLGYRNSNGTTNGALRKSMPPLKDLNDPLLDSVRTLLDASAERDRVKRVALLAAALHKADGSGAVVLLDMLRRSPLPAAQNPDVAAAVTRHLASASPATREAAARTLREILEADYLEQAPLCETAVAKCVDALNQSNPNIASRTAVIRALGAAGAAAAKSDEAMRILAPAQEAGNVTITQEISARLRALGDLKTDVRHTVGSALHQVPLDDNGEYSRAAEYAFASVDPDHAAAALSARLGLRVAAGLDGDFEIESMALLPPDRAIPALVAVSKLDLNGDEKATLAEACRKLAGQQRDARLVEPLSGLLAPDERSRESAILALLEINSDDAAKALLPHLREEENLYQKLRIAEMLGHHGFRDGYAFAIEHVSESWLLEQAVAALAAIREPQAVVRLKEILKSSNDVAWNTAAVRGLGAMGMREMTPEFLTMVSDLRNPLAPAALLALADLGEVKALDKTFEGLASRNDRVVAASARAAGKLLMLPGVDGTDLKARLLTIFVDPDADQTSRAAALEAMLACKDEQLAAALPQVAREAGLQGSSLMQSVEKLLRERKMKL